MKLFILGNGFDIKHDLPTRYADFRKYLQASHPKQERLLTEIFEEGSDEDEDKLWSSVEESLSYLTPETMVLMADDIYLGEDFLYSDAFCEELEKHYQPLKLLPIYLAEWIRSISLTSIYRYAEIDNNSFYLTFNYTETLERIYGIDNNSILHVHGKVGSNLIFGYQENYSEEFSHLPREPKGPSDPIFDPDNADWRVTNTQEFIKDSTGEFYKPIHEKLIPKLKNG